MTTDENSLLKKHLAVALDAPSPEHNLELVDQLGDRVLWYKVGLSLFVREGPRTVAELLARQRRVFLDLKFHDIPHTVANAVRAACEIGAHLCTVHAGAGKGALKAASETSAAFGEARTRVVAVTALTSQSGAGVGAQVERMALEARDSGCDGIVCSALEVARVRKLVGSAFLIVTPGIRFGQSHDDQARVATPAAAVEAGTNLLVVGRPIYAADDPTAALDAIEQDLEKL